MSSRDIGLIRKYDVSRVDGKPVVDAFVLEDKDPFAPQVLMRYALIATSATYYPLANDLRAKAKAWAEAHLHDGHRCGKEADCLMMRGSLREIARPDARRSEREGPDEPEGES